MNPDPSLPCANLFQRLLPFFVPSDLRYFDKKKRFRNVLKLRRSEWWQSGNLYAVTFEATKESTSPQEFELFSQNDSYRNWSRGFRTTPLEGRNTLQVCCTHIPRVFPSNLRALLRAAAVSSHGPEVSPVIFSGSHWNSEHTSHTRPPRE